MTAHRRSLLPESFTAVFGAGMIAAAVAYGALTGHEPWPSIVGGGVTLLLGGTAAGVLRAARNGHDDRRDDA